MRKNLFLVFCLRASVLVTVFPVPCWAQFVTGWGENFAGQISIPFALPDIAEVAAGSSHTLARGSNGTVVAWGENTFGQATVPPGLSNIAGIAAGYFHSAALRSNGTVVTWGSNGSGEQDVPPGLSGVKQIASSGFFTLVLKENGTVVGWGENFAGQTTAPQGLNDVRMIAAGHTHSLALRSNGTVVAWGTETFVPPDLSNVAAISAGVSWSLALRSNGTVVAWGDNSYDQTNVPAGLSGVVAIAAGYSHGLALKSDGTVVGWGNNQAGQSTVPPGLNNVRTVSGGGSHSLALSSSPYCLVAIPDDFQCRQTITGTNIVFQASNVGATSEVGEPAHSDNVSLSPNKSLWYEWTAPFSGGAVVAATAAQIDARVVAVYTRGDSGSLNLVARCASLFESRVAFRAVAGQKYQIALDGSPFGGGNADEGDFTFSLRLTPPPVNDSFASSLSASGLFYTNSGSFLGASKEPGEPNHGHASYLQTLWWNWAVPASVDVASLPVRLTADGVSFYPDIGVYVGNSISNLAPVTPSLVSSQGMTRSFDFDAVPGTTYRIALGGIQHDPGENGSSPRFGDYRFRLNARALVLSISNLSTNTLAPDSELTFAATARIHHAGSVTSGPLRVNVMQLSGVSVLGFDNGYSFDTTLISTDAVFSTLAPGQDVSQGIGGTIPAPIVNGTTGIGYGAYAELQEQSASGSWHSVDQAIIVFGNWPYVGETPGPGGGVIRLDPGYLGLANNNPLTSVQIVGPPIVPEGSRTPFAGKATFLLGQTVTFTQTLWTASRFAMNTNGVFLAGSVTNDTPVTLTNAYSYSGLIYHGWTNLLVSNLPPPFLMGQLLSPTNIALTVIGVPGRSNRVEATTNLNPPTTIWLSLVTNAPANGAFAFTNAIQTNVPRQFFRVRELE